MFAAPPPQVVMVPASIVITADRGSLKAYQVNETPTRGPSLKLIQAFDITDAHGKLIDKVTDLAGRFAVTEGAGAQRRCVLRIFCNRSERSLTFQHFETVGRDQPLGSGLSRGQRTN